MLSRILSRQVFQMQKVVGALESWERSVVTSLEDLSETYSKVSVSQSVEIRLQVILFDGVTKNNFI